MKLGLFGGTFNPVHYGHLGIAGQARERLQLDRILFIPTGDPPHKQDGDLAPAKDRYEMVRLAIASDPAFALSDVEVRRGGKSYSIDTVHEIQRQSDAGTELYFLIGLDAFLDFPSWREPHALLAACRFVVISRPGQSFQSLKTLPMLPALDVHALARLDSRQPARVDVDLPDGRNLTLLSLPPCSISASEIRQRIRAGAALANLLPPTVESYILQHRLYQEDPNHTHI